MLTFFRRIINSRWGAAIALIFVVMIGLAFALGDVTGSGAFGGLSEGYVAKVGKKKISLSELQEALDLRLDQARKDNPTLDMATFVRGGGFDATLDALISSYALAAYGEENGLAVSKRLIDSEIMKIPGIRGLDGKFSSGNFAAFLQQRKLSEQTFRGDLTRSFFATQMGSTMQQGGKTPESMALPYLSLALEKRAGSVGLVPSAAFIPKDPPSDAQISKFYKDNSARFTVPEKRAINYAIFDKSIVGDRASVTDAEIADYFKSNSAKFAASQTRDFSVLVFPSESAAKDAAGKIGGGQTLAAVAKQLGLTTTSSADISKDALIKSASKAVADAVFAADRGAVAVPARGALGWYLVQVTGVKDVGAKTLAAATAEIKTEIETRKRAEVLSDITVEMQNQFEDGSTIADVAKANGLKIETTPKLLGNGQNPENPGYKPIPEMAAILPAAFGLRTDGEAQLIEIVPNERFALVSVADFNESAPAPLATIKDVVVRQWALAEGNKKAKATAEDVRKAVLGGKTLVQALAATGVKLPAAQPVAGSRAQLQQQGQKVPPPLALLFAMVKGSAKTLDAGQDQGWYVVQLQDVIRTAAKSDDPALGKSREAMGQVLAQESFDQLILAARAEVGVEKNESAIKQLRDRLTKKDSAN